MKKLFIKNYLINSILKCGKKELSEKILLKTFKELQRTTKINTKNLIKLAIIKTISIVEIKKLKKKKKFSNNGLNKVIPFVRKKKYRIFLSIKAITKQQSLPKMTNYSLYLKQKIIDSATQSMNQNNVKLELSREAFLKKKFVHYRWFI